MAFSPISRVSGAKGSFLHVHWRQLGVWLIFLIIGSWFLVTLGAWLYVKYRRDFPAVKYADLLWPGRWPQYRVSQGNFYIAQSESLLRQGEYSLALHKLRVGVRKAPANAQGRTLLARVYLAHRRPDLAKDVLLDGLAYLPEDPAYLQTTLAFLLEFQEDAQLLEITRRLLAGPVSPTTRPLVATFAATAAYHRGNYDQAEDLIDRHRLHRSPEGAVLQARIAWERGFPELTLLRLKEHLVRHPGHDGARALLADYYLSLERITEWESALVERVAGDPLAPAPRVAYLQLHQRRGDQARLERETAGFLQQFASDPPALLRLANFAATHGQPALAHRVQQVLAGRPEYAGAAALLVAESHLVAGDYQTALDLIAGYTKEYPVWAGQFAPVFTGLQVVALSGLGRADEARLSLDHLLVQKNLRAENLVAVAGRLSDLGARELALSALGRAVETDPLNQAALAHLIRLELKTGNIARLTAHLERYLRTRQPSREILARAGTVLGSDLHLLLPAQKPLLASLQAALDQRQP
jgi:tetratricopeptide (TPR) repeat protein